METRLCSDDSYIVEAHSAAVAMEPTRKGVAIFPTSGGTGTATGYINITIPSSMLALTVEQ